MGTYAPTYSAPATTPHPAVFDAVRAKVTKQHFVFL